MLLLYAPTQQSAVHAAFTVNFCVIPDAGLSSFSNLRRSMSGDELCQILTHSMTFMLLSLCACDVRDSVWTYSGAVCERMNQ